jgi:hypothetical protein
METRKVETDMGSKIEDLCPECGEPLYDMNDIIIAEAREATVLVGCINCEKLFGRYT